MKTHYTHDELRKLQHESEHVHLETVDTHLLDDQGQPVKTASGEPHVLARTVRLINPPHGDAPAGDRLVPTIAEITIVSLNGEHIGDAQPGARPE